MGRLRRPAVPAGLPERPRLEERIATLAATRALVTVIAAPGAGKTTAVARACDLVGIPSGWLAVDDTDAEPERLLAYLEAALAIHAPEAAGSVAAALRDGLSCREAAGLLAEAGGEAPFLLVIDDVDRIAGSPAALEVLSTLIRFAPGSLHIVLVASRDLPLDVGLGALLDRSAAIGDPDLAFTPDEAAEALAAAAGEPVDASAAVAATGGWVAGVLLEGLPGVRRSLGLGGETSPLHGYLARGVLSRLEPAQLELLVETAPLQVVTVAGAEALGLADSARLLAGLRGFRLPVDWDPSDDLAFSCRPCLRDYLLLLLERRPADDVARIRLGCATLLDRNGRPAEAIEEYLRAGRADLALDVMARALEPALETGGGGLVEGWLAALRESADPDHPTLARAELMLAVAGERWEDGARLADRLAALGRLSALSGLDGGVGVLAGWCYWEAGRPDDARAVAEALDAEPAVGLRSLLALSDPAADAGPAALPVLDGSIRDALALRALVLHGWFSAAAECPRSPWAAAVSAPWRVTALRSLGRHKEARELATDIAATASPWLRAVELPLLELDRGHLDEAWFALAAGREAIGGRGTALHSLLAALTEAKLGLVGSAGATGSTGVTGGPIGTAGAGAVERAEGILAGLDERAVTKRYRQVADELGIWTGMALLLRNHNAEAARRLRETVAAMVAGDRLGALPTGCVFLAEAEARVGRPRVANKALDTALAASLRQGSHHELLQALALFPAVVARRIARELTGDSTWQTIGRGLLTRGDTSEPSALAEVHLHEFGPPRIDVEGVPRLARIKKSYELLAYLASRERPEADRDELLDVLFDGRADDSARSYLRQSVHRLREVLPDDAVLGFECGRLRLAGVRIACDARRIDSLIADAEGQQGRHRLALLLEALQVLDSGEYLDGSSSEWVEERREEFAQRAAEIRHEAAELHFADAQLAASRRLALAVLRGHPYREATWRLLMRIAHAAGDNDGVLRAYHLCEGELQKIGMQPSPTTRTLLNSLRR